MTMIGRITTRITTLHEGRGSRGGRGERGGTSGLRARRDLVRRCPYRHWQGRAAARSGPAASRSRRRPADCFRVLLTPRAASLRLRKATSPPSLATRTPANPVRSSDLASASAASCRPIRSICSPEKGGRRQEKANKRVRGGKEARHNEAGGNRRGRQVGVRWCCCCFYDIIMIVAGFESACKSKWGTRDI